MHGHVTNRWIALDQRLGAVAVVHVPVHDEHARLTELLSVARRHDHIVKEAESHRVRRQGVMPRRPGRAERRPSLDAELHGTDRCTGGRERRVPASIDHHGIGVEGAAARPRQALEHVQVGCRMDSF